MPSELLRIDDISSVVLLVRLSNGERRFIVTDDIRRGTISPISTIDGYDHADVQLTLGIFAIAAGRVVIDTENPPVPEMAFSGLPGGTIDRYITWSTPASDS